VVAADLPAPPETHGDRPGRGRGGRRGGQAQGSPLAGPVSMIRRVVAIALIVGGDQRDRAGREELTWAGNHPYRAVPGPTVEW
jgi:hypothetical protein